MAFSQFFCIFDFWEVFPSAWASLWLQSLGWEDPLEKGKATH